MPASVKPTNESAAPIRAAAPALLRRRGVQAALLCLAAFGMAAAVAFGVFEAMPHLEDEHGNYFQARVFARGELAAPAPPDNAAFFIPFVVIRGGIWFGKYTPGYPLVLALFLLAGVPWAANALASALTLLGTFLLGRDLFDSDSGLLAACLGAAAPAFVVLSGSLLPHPVTAAALVFFAWAFLRARQPGRRRAGLYALAAGLLLGFAALCRPWTALAVAAPFAAIAAFDLARAAWPGRGTIDGQEGRSTLRPYAKPDVRDDMRHDARPDGRGAPRPYGARPEGRSTLRPYVGIYIILAVACVAVALLLPAFNWAVTGDPLRNTYTLWWPYDTVGFGPSAGRPPGHTLELGLINVTLDLAAFQTAFLGWPAPLGIPLAALPLLLGMLLAPRSRADLLLLAVPAVLVAAHVLYWARAGEYYGGRYYSEGMPFLWLLAARGLLKFSRGRIRSLLVRLALPAALLWGIGAEILPRFDRGRGLYGISRGASDLAAAADLNNALVFVHVRDWTDCAEFSWLNSPFLDGDVVFARDMGSDINARIIAAFPGRTVYVYDGYRGGDPLMLYETPP